MVDHERWMRQSIEIASRNPDAPFGSILVEIDSDRAVALGINKSRSNPILHGEMDAINNYSLAGGRDWNRLSLYTTAEPCCMCQAAIIWAGIPRIVFGTSIATLKVLGWRQFDLTAAQVAQAAPFSDCQILGNVLAPECDDLFRRARQ